MMVILNAINVKGLKRLDVFFLMRENNTLNGKYKLWIQKYIPTLEG